MTAKNVQAAAAKQGYPWAICKGLDTFTPIGEFIPKSETPDPHDVHLEFKVGEDPRLPRSRAGGFEPNRSNHHSG
jgi:acylpyruvate hydrolase